MKAASLFPSAIRLRAGFLCSPVMFICVILASAGTGHADMICSAGTVTSILHSTCTIGNITLNGFDFSESGVSVPADEVIFTPDASNPSSPGFTLSPAPGFSFSIPASANGETFNPALAFTASSPAVILGVTVTQSGAEVGSATNGGGDALAQIFLDNTNVCSVAQSVGIEQVGTVTVLATSSDTVYPIQAGCLGTLVFGTLDIVVDGQVVAASITSARFNLIEAPTAVPEPNSLALLGTGMLALVAAFRQKRSSFKLPLPGIRCEKRLPRVPRSDLVLV